MNMDTIEDSLEILNNDIIFDHIIIRNKIKSSFNEKSSYSYK